MDKYPSIDDKDFQFIIARRLEFRNLENIDGLYPHQEFVRRFMSPYTPYKSLIMYHSLGSGKSIACIAVAVDHYMHDRKKCIIVTKGDSGTENFAKQIDMYYKMSSRRTEWDLSMFSYKHYISLSNTIKNMSDNEIYRAYSNSIIILDEVHNVRYLKKETEKSVYGSIIRLLKLCYNVKVIIATATPMTDSSEQVQSLLGICNYARSENYKNSMAGIISYNSAILHKPESLEIGTEEYIEGVNVYPSYMQGHQLQVYREEHDVKPPTDIYRKLTHISLFCFDDGTHGSDITENKMVKKRMKKTITSMLEKKTKEIKYIKYNIQSEYTKMLVGENLRNSSCKYSKVIYDLENNSRGNTFIFLEEVKGSGLLLLAAVLEQHGYELYLGEDLKNLQEKKRYTMCVGSSEICPNNADRLEGFNSDLNMDGSYVEVLLGSRVIGESITLKNVRQFYCLTPHWNDSTVDQAIGRVVRNGSHASLEKNQRNVNIYIHTAIFPDDPMSSVDIKKLAKCKEKEKEIKLMAEKMVDSAVDKYKDDTNMPITYVSTYAVAYLHNIMTDLTNRITFYLSKYISISNNSIDIDILSNYMSVNPIICREALCRIISSNTQIQLHNFGPHTPNFNLNFSNLPRRGDQAPMGGKFKTVFLRAYGNTVFTVDDPSLPFVTMQETTTEQNNYDNDNTENNISVSISISMENIDIHTFRYMPVKHKAAVIEECILKDKIDILDKLSLNTLYANIDGIVCHLLLYRDLESSYTSSNPVPKKPSGKTRMLMTSEWITVTDTEIEQGILNEYRILIYDLIQYYDQHYSIYGIISTIDGDMRLRLRESENIEKSSIDNRYIRRGKNMRSIKKEYLIDILNKLDNNISREYVSNMSINEIARRIDDALVNLGLYVVL